MLLGWPHKCEVITGSKKATPTLLPPCRVGHHPLLDPHKVDVLRDHEGQRRTAFIKELALNIPTVRSQTECAMREQNLLETSGNKH